MLKQPRVLLIGGLVLLLLAGALHVTLRLTFGERSAYVHVRYTPAVDDAARAAIEKAYGLEPVEFREQRTWGYFLTDLSTDNIRGLVQNPAIEDTHHIDRRQFRVTDTGDRGEYPGGRPAWIPRTLESLRRISLLLGIAGLAVGAYRLWR